MLLEDKINEIAGKLKITDVVSEYTDIYKEGKTAICDCTFCKEKDRMVVSDEKNFFKCYSCGEEGGVADFVARYEHISRKDACRKLCEMNGIGFDVELSKDERDMYSAVSKSAQYFHHMMKREATAVTYLKDRGITPITMKKFAIGYADAKWTSLRDVLKREGIAEDIMIKAGLISVNTKTHNTYDRFTDRIMFPIINENNDVIGFSGRLFRDTDKRDSKYFNSPASDIFKKSSVLFGINYAVKSDKRAWILCEGQMDVVTSHQYGYDSTVASLGTAMTKAHANLIRQYTKTVYLAYDSDGAGVKATLRNIPVLRRAGLNVKVIDLAPYKDPDELLKAEGNDYYNHRIIHAIDSYDYEIMEWARSCYNFETAEWDDDIDKFNEKYNKAIINSPENEVKAYMDAYGRIFGYETISYLDAGEDTHAANKEIADETEL